MGKHKTHGHSRLRHGKCSMTYTTWRCMWRRVLDDKHLSYKYYGGRGIRVDDRWSIFANFLEDMGKRPSRSHTLDRLDVDGDYEPLNCMWATKKQQANNRRRSGRQLPESNVVYEF